METIRFKNIFFNIIQTPLLRHLLIFTIGAAIFFPIFSFYIIFPKFTKQLIDYAEDSAKRVAAHLTESVLNDKTTLTYQSFTPDVKENILKLMKDMRLEKIKVFSNSGEVLFSSNKKDIGGKNVHDYFHNQVALGHIYSKMVQKGSKTMEGRMVDGEVIEIYVPLMFQNTFSGAAEVYYDITDNKNALTKLLNQLKIILLIFSSIFILILFIILFKTSRNIIERDTAQKNLTQAHAQLEKTIKIRTADLKTTNESLLKEIEEHRMSDLARRENERRLKTILEANPQPLAIYDLEGLPQYFNPAFTDLFGWTIGELENTIIPFVPENQTEENEKKIKELYQFGIITSFETQRITKDNRTLDVILSAALMRDLDEKPSGIVLNLTDISEKKALEAQFKKSQRLESLGTLAGGIAHDFNNILSGILGYAQLAKINIKFPEKTTDALDQIIKGILRASELIQQILTFSRKTEYKKQPLQVYTLVYEALKLMQSSIPSSITIKKNILSKALIMADSGQIHQVVMNLCTNAYQAMEENGGTLTADLQAVDITSRATIHSPDMKPGPYLRLEITDTGHGIGSNNMDKIFEPYFTTKEQDKGTGLGLAVVHGIVKDHGGYLNVQSKQGVGSRFSVFLPVLEHSPAEETAEEFKKEVVRGSERIMFVDDEDSISGSAMSFFKDMGYTTQSFSNGKKALAAFKKNPYEFDIVITDLSMPSLSGDELAKCILNIRPEIPVILCSGYVEKISEQTLYDIGIKQFLQKPIALENLADVIRQHLDTN